MIVILVLQKLFTYSIWRKNGIYRGIKNPQKYKEVSKQENP